MNIFLNLKRHEVDYQRGATAQNIQVENFTYKYSVMQSDGNSFCGEVVLVSFNMVYSDEYII